MRRTRFIVTAKDHEPDGWGRREDEILAFTEDDAARIFLAAHPRYDIVSIDRKVRGEKRVPYGMPDHVILCDRHGKQDCAVCAADTGEVREVFIDPPRTTIDTAMTKPTRKVERNPLDIRQHRIPKTRKIPKVKRETSPLKRLARSGGVILHGTETKAAQFGAQIRDRHPEYVGSGTAGHWNPQPRT